MLQFFQTLASFGSFGRFSGWFRGPWGRKRGDGHKGADDVHKGTNDSDILTGTDGNETFLARRGDDIIEPRGGNDVVDGGRGFDTARYAGSIDDYDIHVSGPKWGFAGWGWGWGHWGRSHTSSVRVTTEGSSDRLKGVEVLEFEDAYYYLDGRPDPIVFKDGSGAEDDEVNANEDTPITIALADLVANDTGANGATPIVFAIEGVPLGDLVDGAAIELASGARLVREADDQFIYDPNGQFEQLGPNDVADDSFEYAIDDGNGGTHSAQVTVHVQGANDLPTGLPVLSNTTPTAGESVAADLDQISDPEGITGNFSYQWEAFSDGEWTAISGANEAILANTEDYIGQQLRVRVSFEDGGGTQEVVVSEPTAPVSGEDNNPPVANDDDVTITSPTEPVTINLLANDSDDDGDPLTITFDPLQLPDGVMAELRDIDADGFAESIELIPDLDAGATFPPAFEFQYEINDGRGGSDTATVRVTVDSGLAGTVVDGYVAGGTVFADTDGSGVLDGTETSARTDGFGNFNLQGSAGGILIHEGGIDTATLRPVTGQMRAPEGSTVITPLTTLAVAMMAQDSSLTSEDAAELVREAFRLDTSFDLFNTDPVAAFLSGDQAAAEATATLSVLQNAVTLIGTMIDAVPNDGEIAGADAAMDAFATVMLTGERTDLPEIIEDAALRAGVQPALAAELGQGGANVIEELSQAASDQVVGEDPLAILTGLTQVSVVARGEAADALADAAEAAAAGGTDPFSDVIAAFSGTELDQKVSAAEVGDVDGGIGIDDAVTTNQNTAVEIDLISNDINYVTEDPTLSFAIGAVPKNGSVTDNGDGTVTYTPFTGFVGTDIFTYTVTNALGEADEATVTVAVGDAEPIMRQNVMLADIADETDPRDGFKIIGEEIGDRAGVSVAAAGDVNGDGIGDVIVGAVDNDANGAVDIGAAYVIYGSVTPLGTVNLDDIADDVDASDGFKIIGETPDDNAGISVTSIGDIDGDGHSDLLVGARNNGANGPESGAAYVVLGGSSLKNVDLSMIGGGIGSDAGFRIIGEKAGDNAGFSVASAGDLNRDGINDLIIGAPQGAGGMGAAYVVYGTTEFATIELRDIADESDRSDGFMIVGEEVDDLAGNSVAGIGDVNGDGLADIAIGASVHSAGEQGNGAAYVVFGSEDLLPTVHLTEIASDTEPTQGIKITGEPIQFGQAGYSIAGAGDVNNDGFDDLLVGSFIASGGPGAAYVVYGSEDLTHVDLTSVGDDPNIGFKIVGEAEFDFAGSSVDAVGDMNGDGFGDILVSGVGGGVAGDAAGAAYVIYGAADLTRVDLAEIADDADASDGFKIFGEADGDEAGVSVAAAGDVNNDGYADLIVGAHREGTGGDDAGAAYVIYGGPEDFLLLS